MAYQKLDLATGGHGAGGSFGTLAAPPGGRPERVEDGGCGVTGVPHPPLLLLAAAAGGNGGG